MSNRLEIRQRLGAAAELLERGEATQAEQRCRILLASTRSAEVLHLLGLCQLQLGRAAEAVSSFQEALRLHPDDPRILQDLGRAFSSRGEWQAAAQSYLRAMDLDPGNPLNYLYLGPIYEYVDDPDSAERAYRQALSLDPNLAAAAASLASLYEKANRIEEAERLATRALQLDAAEPVANLVRAQLDYRAGQYQDAADRLRRLLEQPLSVWNRSLAAGKLGAALDRLDQPEAAFAAFVSGKEALNEVAQTAPDTRLYSMDTLNRIGSHLDALLAPASPLAAASSPTPVFLVGFPRSGTTLLDQILSSHPGIIVLEEKNALRDSLQEFAVSEEGLRRLETLSEGDSANYRRLYWQRVAEVIREPIGQRLLVDKLPLYSAFMPVIRRIFPEARFIFALRDPRDVILSCLMHPFGLNEAMRHFLTLEGTADFYVAVMDIASRSMDSLGPAVHWLRYETLIGDLENQTRALCDFLGLPWEPEMLQYHDRARARRINTPSYHQVVQPVYRTAMERWRRYTRQLQPVLPRLEPFVTKFGYT